MLKVVCVKAVVLWVQVPGEGVCCHLGGVEVADGEVDVVFDAVGDELEGQTLEVGLASSCMGDVSNGCGGVHPEVYSGVFKVCSEGFDGE